MRTTLRRLSGMTLLAALVCFPARAQQQSQQSGSNDPVVEAAKKAREQKKDAPKPKRVYTDDDLSTKKSDISVVGTAPAPAPGTENAHNPGSPDPTPPPPAPPARPGHAR